MEIQSVFSSRFSEYGRVLTSLDVTELLQVLRDTTEKPQDGVVYVPSHAPLETLPVCTALQDRIFGGMPIQIGYCNGTNTKLGCLEYHRDSEINITAGEMVFLLAREQDIQNGQLSTRRVEAFRAPAGAVVELYATTLHYAPCDGKRGEGFRVAIVLPRGTNLEAPALPTPKSGEDALLWARNKWLLAHADSQEASQGAFVGLIGENPDIASDL